MKKVGDVAQMEECLSSIHEALGLTSILHKLGVLVPAYNPSTSKKWKNQAAKMAP